MLKLKQVLVGSNPKALLNHVLYKKKYTFWNVIKIRAFMYGIQRIYTFFSTNLSVPVPYRFAGLSFKSG